MSPSNITSRYVVSILEDENVGGPAGTGYSSFFREFDSRFEAMAFMVSYVESGTDGSTAILEEVSMSVYPGNDWLHYWMNGEWVF